jgi:hypothetical protein
MILRGFARWTLITAQVLDGPPGDCSPSVDFSADPCRFAPAGICISGKHMGYGVAGGCAGSANEDVTLSNMPWIWPRYHIGQARSRPAILDASAWAGLGWDDNMCIACIVMCVTVVRADIH